MGEKIPFYRTPERRITSADIIRDAKKTIRSISTKRPFTPRDEKRTLFGEGSNRNPDARPASTYSIGPRHFEGLESRPVSGTRLSPINHPLNLPSDLEAKLIAPKPPSEESKPAGYKGSRLHTKLLTGPIADCKNNEPAHRPNSLNTEKHLKHSKKPYFDNNDSSTEAKTQETSRTPQDEAFPTKMLCATVTEKSFSKPSELNENKQRLSNNQANSNDELVEDRFFVQFINPLLENLALLKEKKAAEEMVAVADDLYTLLEKENLLGRNCKQRSVILKAIFELLDYDHSAVLVSLSQLILSFQVTKKNLLNACKLVFKVSRNEQNDQLFLKGHILDQLLQVIQATDPNSNTDTLIYCVGALKLLSGSNFIMKELVQKRCIEILTYLLKAINSVSSKDSGCNREQLGNLLVQLTACLRNLVDASGSRQHLLNSSLISALCCTMQIYLDDADLVLNISRIFSKVSLHTDCCIELADQKSSYQTLVKVLEKHIARQDIVVRVFFVLGNITAKNETARILLFEEKNALLTFQKVLEFYIERSIPLNDGNESLIKNTSKIENGKNYQIDEIIDVLIKTVRLIANLSISEMIGPIIAADQCCVNQLLHLLKNCKLEKDEDLLVTTVATINNLSYYHDKGSHIFARYLDIAKCLINLLVSSNKDALLEAARVLGNLTHQKIVRDFLADNAVQEILIASLDSNNREIVYICCGVLVNFMADREKRFILRKEGGIQKLVEVLHDFGPNDWQLSGVVCQVLLNYSRDISSTNLCFGYELGQQLIDILSEFLDESAVMSMISGGGEKKDISEINSKPMEVQQLIMEMWSCDFFPVATQLLERLQEYLSPLEPIEEPEEELQLNL